MTPAWRTMRNEKFCYVTAGSRRMSCAGHPVRKHDAVLGKPRMANCMEDCMAGLACILGEVCVCCDCRSAWCRFADRYAQLQPGFPTDIAGTGAHHYGRRSVGA